MEAALAVQGRAIHIANRRTGLPTPWGAPAAPPGAAGVGSPPPNPASTAETLPLHNREQQMAAPVKPTAAPSAESITAKKLELKKENRDFLLQIHRTMQLIRRFEERAQEQYTKAKIGGYCHLNIGEEATVVGAILPLKLTDYIFTSYREHGHAIARGIDPKAVMAELFGKETGTSHGRGGSMHMFDAKLRFMRR